MHRDGLNWLTLVGFGLILLSFLVRGLGQFLVGPERIISYAGPIAVLALAVLVLTLTLWVLDRVGLWSLERDP